MWVAAADARAAPLRYCRLVMEGQRFFAHWKIKARRRFVSGKSLSCGATHTCLYLGAGLSAGVQRVDAFGLY